MVRIPRNGVEGKKKKKPSFFKIILPGYSTEQMRIPPRFVRKHLGNKLSETATLKLMRSSECSWSVSVTKSGANVYLKDGWPEFLRDASLGDKEFLLFISNGKMRFSVEVYDKNACERMDFPDLRTHQNTTSSMGTTEKRCGRPRKNGLGNSSDQLKEATNKENEAYSGNTRKFTSKSTERPCDKPIKITAESSKRPRGRPRIHPLPCADSLRTSNSSKENSGNNISDSEFDGVEEVVEEEEECNLESNELFKSGLQHCTKRIVNPSRLYLPAQFYKGNLLSGNFKDVLLKTSEGTKWYKVKLTSCRPSAVITTGWSAFAMANQVKIGSLCKFEFLKENKIVVHILN